MISETPETPSENATPETPPKITESIPLSDSDAQIVSQDTTTPPTQDTTDLNDILGDTSNDTITLPEKETPPQKSESTSGNTPDTMEILAAAPVAPLIASVDDDDLLGTIMEETSQKQQDIPTDQQVHDINLNSLESIARLLT